MPIKEAIKVVTKGFKSRVQLNDTTTLMEINTSDASAETILDRWGNDSGFKQVELSSGNHNIDLDFCSAYNLRGVKIRRVRIKIRRIK